MERERFEQNHLPESAPELMTGTEKFEQILKMFGTDESKKAFLDVCSQYLEERRKHIINQYSENYTAARNPARYSPPRRAEYHNKIMKTLQHLALAPRMSTVQRDILKEMSNRDFTAEIIRQYFDTVTMTRSEGDEELDQTGNLKRRDNESDVGYFRRWGKERE
ncbi:MAG TPA: hypothetical protein VHA30_03050 [Patescibacteria group bacterium]|nr:hypothetical protein [Patescibacteria group bacterium]